VTTPCPKPVCGSAAASDEPLPHLDDYQDVVHGCPLRVQVVELRDGGDQSGAILRQPQRRGAAGGCPLRHCAARAHARQVGWVHSVRNHTCRARPARTSGSAAEPSRVNPDDGQTQGASSLGCVGIQPNLTPRGPITAPASSLSLVLLGLSALTQSDLPRPCVSCAAPPPHVPVPASGGVGWVTYQPQSDVLFYCKRREVLVRCGRMANGGIVLVCGTATGVLGLDPAHHSRRLHRLRCLSVRRALRRRRTAPLVHRASTDFAASCYRRLLSYPHALRVKDPTLGHPSPNLRSPHMPSPRLTASSRSATRRTLTASPLLWAEGSCVPPDHLSPHPLTSTTSCTHPCALSYPPKEVEGYAGEASPRGGEQGGAGDGALH